MLRDCICSKWIVSGGEQSTGEFSKRSCDRSPQQRRPVPSGGTSQGILWGPGSAPKPSRQWLVPLSSLSQPWLCHSTVVSGQGPFNKCWPEDNSSIFTKKCSAAKSGLIPAANEKISLFFGLFFFFFLLQSFLESWCGAGTGANADLGIMPLPTCLPIPGAGSSTQSSWQSGFFSLTPSRAWGEKGKYSLLCGSEHKLQSQRQEG